MKDPNILLKKRVTLLVAAFLDTAKDFWSGEYFKKVWENKENYPRTYVAWPIGKLIVLRDRLVIGALWNKWELSFNEISYIQKNDSVINTIRIRETLRKGIMINHKSKEVPKFVYMKGFGYNLFELLKEINSKNKLGLKFIKK